MAVKPRVFVGSSTKGLDAANVIQQNLEHYAHVRPWNQGVFGLSQTTIESLMEALAASDFGVFVLTPDDVAAIKGQDVQTARDNVIFVLGLFTGRLGRRRSFFVQPRPAEQMHLPSDLAGVTPGLYDQPDDPTDLQALRWALGPACTEIRAAIQQALAADLAATYLGPRLVYLLRHLARDAEWRLPSEYAEVLAVIPNGQDHALRPVPPDLEGWSKAADYACHYLARIGLVAFQDVRVRVTGRGKDYAAGPLPTSPAWVYEIPLVPPKPAVA
jgi:hypothetical protein